MSPAAIFFYGEAVSSPFAFEPVWQGSEWRFDTYAKLQGGGSADCAA